jgi:hypothetical protein
MRSALAHPKLSSASALGFEKGAWHTRLPAGFTYAFYLLPFLSLFTFSIFLFPFSFLLGWWERGALFPYIIGHRGGFLPDCVKTQKIKIIPLYIVV